MLTKMIVSAFDIGAAILDTGERFLDKRKDDNDGDEVDYTLTNECVQNGIELSSQILNLRFTEWHVGRGLINQLLPRNQAFGSEASEWRTPLEFAYSGTLDYCPKNY
jgi:hypothetical protein